MNRSPKRLLSFTRWFPTLLGFPLGGYLAVETVGSLAGPVTAAAGGLLAGAVIGAAQWLAVRSRGIGRRWVPVTAAAMAAGTAVAAGLTGAGTDLPDLMATGLMAGAAVGAAQGTLLGGGRAVGAAWTAVTAASWSLGWLATWSIGVDAERGYYVFGLAGAILAAALTGLALRWAFARPAMPGTARPAAASA